MSDTQTTDAPKTAEDARTLSRIDAAAEWLMSDDTAYEHNPEAAQRAARSMLAAADEIEARFEAASQRAIAILGKGDAP